jgi:hypothetical protein
VTYSSCVRKEDKERGLEGVIHARLVPENVLTDAGDRPAVSMDQQLTGGLVALGDEAMQ